MCPKILALITKQIYYNFLVITLRKIILLTNWLRFFVYSTNLVCKMNNCIIPLTI